MVLRVPRGPPRAGRFPFAGDPLLFIRVLITEGEGVEEVGIREGGEAGARWRRREAVRLSQSQRGNGDVKSDRLHVSAPANLLQSVLLLLAFLLGDEAQNL